MLAEEHLLLRLRLSLRLVVSSVLSVSRGGRVSAFTLGREWIVITSCCCVAWVGEHGGEGREGLVRRPFASVGDVGASLALVYQFANVHYVR